MNIYEHGIVTDERLTDTSLRIIATTDLPVYSGFSMAIVGPNGESLSERGMNVASVDPSKPCWCADYYEEADLRYCIGSMLYHLSRIAELYAWVTQLFEKHHKMVTSGTTGDARIYYEVEAFFDCARRVYETIRKVLWKHYGRGNDRWSTVFTVPKNRHRVPMEFINTLVESFSAFGNDVKAYRDCVAHCDPLNDGGTSCWTNGHMGRWGVTIKLPENPHANSRTLYRFDAGPDALSYCHSVACHLVGLCEELSDLEVIRTHLNYPEKASGWLLSVERAKTGKSP